MKRFILVLLLFLGYITYGRPSTAKIIFHFKKGAQLAVGNSSAVFTKFENKLYYTMCSEGIVQTATVNGTDSVYARIYTYDFVSDATDSFTLQMPRTTQWSLRGIAVNDKYIALESDSIYLFDRKSRKFLDTLNSYNAGGIDFINDHQLFIYKNYDFHPLDDSVKTQLIIYDLEKKRPVVYLKPKFRYIGYTHLVNNFISVSGKYIAFAQTMPYDIKIFSAKDLSLTGEIKDALNNDPRQMAEIDSLYQRMTSGTFDAKGIIYGLKGIDSITRIEKVIMLSNDTLLVSKKPPKSSFKKRMLDVWVYNRKEGWHCIVKDQLYETEKDNENYQITPETIPFDFTYSNPIPISGNQMYLIGKNVPPAMNISNSDYKKDKDDYYTTHSLNPFIWTYSWEIK